MRLLGRKTFVIALCATTLGAGVASAQATAPAAQARFDTAQAAFDRGDWAGAVAGYRAALAAMRTSSRSVAVIHSRLAFALQQSRQFDAAQTEAKAATSAFAAQKIVQDDDLGEALVLLADHHRQPQTNDLAIEEYRRAIAAMHATSTEAMFAARYGLALATLTAQPDVAASSLDAIVGDAPFFAKLRKADQANILALRGMSDLNRGQAKLAARYIEKALDLIGRTTTRVDVGQIRIRGDAALIYASLGDGDLVRQYLTYSGAGHLPDQSWLSGAEKDLPVCDDEVGPRDVAVVEFAIADDGRTQRTTALYASRPGPVGGVFATAVSKWRWQPAALAKLDPFWRQSVRLELRCVKRPPLVALSDSFRDRTAEWLQQSGLDPALAKRTFDPKTVGDNPVTKGFVALWSARDLHALTEAANALNAALVAAKAPIDVRAFALYNEAAGAGATSRRAGDAGRAKLLPVAIATLEGQAGAERAVAWLRTEHGLALELGNALPAAAATLQSVVAMPAAILPVDDPIRSSRCCILR